VIRWVPERMPARARQFVNRVEIFRQRRGLLVLAIFSGSAIALPPFYLVTLACGMLRVPFALFAIAGLAGTISRYGFLAWFATALTAG
jgi:membrane protein YqaA with SNARE-associated domain